MGVKPAPAILLHDLPSSYSHSDLLTYFAKYGAIDSVEFVRDPYTGANLDIARVQFRISATEDPKEAFREAWSGVTRAIKDIERQRLMNAQFFNAKLDSSGKLEIICSFS